MPRVDRLGDDREILAEQSPDESAHPGPSFSRRSLIGVGGVSMGPPRAAAVFHAKRTQRRRCCPVEMKRETCPRSASPYGDLTFN